MDTCGQLDELEKIYRGGATATTTAASGKDHSDEEMARGEEEEEEEEGEVKRRGKQPSGGKVFSLTGKGEFARELGRLH